MGESLTVVLSRTCRLEANNPVLKPVHCLDTAATFNAKVISTRRVTTVSWGNYQVMQNKSATVDHSVVSESVPQISLDILSSRHSARKCCMSGRGSTEMKCAKNLLGFGLTVAVWSSKMISGRKHKQYNCTLLLSLLNRF